MSPRTVVVRADAGSEMGIGHVMRCLALGQAWQNRGGRVVFALATGASELEDVMRYQNMEIARVGDAPGSQEDAARTLEITERHEARWLVVDGYHFSADYLRSLTRAKSHLLIIADDDEVPSCDCDIVVDPNLERSTGCLEFGQHKELLRGPAYALLRREFVDFPRQGRDVPEIARRILITFGGGDFPNASLTVLRGLQDIVDVDLDVTVVVGPSNEHGTSLQAATKESRHKVTLLEEVDSMAEVLDQADLAITAGGGTCYELAFMRVPMVLITIAENQVQPAKAYASVGAALAGGQLHTLDRVQLSELVKQVIGDRVLRSHLVEQARKMVDGKGAERIVERMLSVSEPQTTDMEPGN